MSKPRYAWLAATPLEALKVILTKPWVVILPFYLSCHKLMFLKGIYRRADCAARYWVALVIGLAFWILINWMLSTYQPQWSIILNL